MGKEWVAFLETIDYPYGARAYRNRIGDERMAWVFFVPGLSEFHSDASWDDLIAAAGAQDALDALNERWESTVGRSAARYMAVQSAGMQKGRPIVAAPSRVGGSSHRQAVRPDLDQSPASAVA